MNAGSCAAWAVLGLSALLASCGARADHERMGDRRYAERSYLDALAEYRLAARQRSPSSELRAKLASAALHAGALEEAVRTYRELGRADPASLSEAADGLVRAARLAVTARDVRALRAAVDALREVAPLRLAAISGPDLLAALGGELRGATDADVILAAASAAGPPVSDSLLVIWGEIAARGGGCGQVTGMFEAVLRRTPAGAPARAARGALAGCYLEDGRGALSEGLLEDAEAALREVVALGMPDSVVRTAWLLIGDVRWAGGDTTTATDAYRRAIAGGPDDSPIVQRAIEQLRRLRGGNPPVP